VIGEITDAWPVDTERRRVGGAVSRERPRPVCDESRSRSSRVHIAKEGRDNRCPRIGGQPKRRVRGQGPCKRDVAVVVDVGLGVGRAEVIEREAQVDQPGGTIIVRGQRIRVESRHNRRGLSGLSRDTEQNHQ
jgi:hypothetical protein